MNDFSANILMFEPQIRFTAFIVTLIVMVICETRVPLRVLNQSRATRWVGNIGASVSGTILAKLVLPLIPTGGAVIAAKNDWGLFNTASAPDWIAVGFSVLALDALIYAQHRVFHAVPFLWRLHRMHHADLELDATTGIRFHPLEILLSVVIKIAAVIALGAPVIAVVIFEIILNATSIFNHSNIRIPPAIDRWLRLIVVTPLMHRVHHSIVREETDSNFGFNLPWWDRLFGTYKPVPASGYDAMVVGLPVFRSEHESRLDKLLVQPFVSERP